MELIAISFKASVIRLYFLGKHEKLNMNLILNGTKNDTLIKSLPQRYMNAKIDSCSRCHKTLITVVSGLTGMGKFSVLPWKSFVKIIYMCT